MALEFLPRALLHDTATMPVELRPLNLGPGVPKQSAHNVGARHAEDRLRLAIKGGETPVTINREETLAHPLEERLNKRVLVCVALSRAHSSIHRDAMLRADYPGPILHRIIR